MEPTASPIRDGEGTLGEYSPDPGAVFVASDTGARYVGDGRRWRRLADPDGPGGTGGRHRGGGVNYEAGYTKPVFHWSFDGGAENNYRYRDVFAELELTPTLAISPARLADDGKMSWDQLRELQTDHGWGVSNHGHRHDRFDELTPAQQEAEVVDAIEAFRREGVDHHHYMYSWGMAGGATGRSVVANYYPFAWGTVHAPETSGIVDVASPYALPRTFVERERPATVEAAIDRAIDRGTGMVLFGHNVVDGESVDPDGFETDVETIERLTRYVRDQGGEWVDDLASVVRHARTPVRIAGGSEPVSVDDLAADTVRADDVAADSVDAAALTADTVRAERLARPSVGLGVAQSDEQALPPGEATTVTLDAARFDHRGEFDPATGTVTVSRPGTFHLTAAVHVRTTGPGSLELRALCDGRPEVVARDTDGRAGVHSRRVDGYLDLDGDETLSLVVEHDTDATAHTCPGRGRVRLDLARLG